MTWDSHHAGRVATHQSYQNLAVSGGSPRSIPPRAAGAAPSGGDSRPSRSARSVTGARSRPAMGDRHESADECGTCGQGIPFYECPASKRPCGHHCNCSWIHDCCHWCGREFGEQSDPITGDITSMESPIIHNNKSDENGNPAGGATHGRGFTIAWQDGPLGRDGDRIEPNGAFVEDVITAAIGRIEFYQASQFNSDYNAKALEHLMEARASLRQRTIDREARAVEGTHAR